MQFLNYRKRSDSQEPQFSFQRPEKPGSGLRHWKGKRMSVDVVLYLFKKNFKNTDNTQSKTIFEYEII